MTATGEPDVEFVFIVGVNMVVEFLFLSNVGLFTVVLLRCGGTGGDIGIGSSIGRVYCGNEK